MNQNVYLKKLYRDKRTPNSNDFFLQSLLCILYKIITFAT